MKLIIEIEMGNDTFGDNPEYETARILRKLADDRVTNNDETEWSLFDFNGNKVGFARIE